MLEKAVEPVYSLPGGPVVRPKTPSPKHSLPVCDLKLVPLKQFTWTSERQLLVIYHTSLDFLLDDSNQIRLEKQTKFNWNVYISTDQTLRNAYDTYCYSATPKDSTGINISKVLCVFTITENGQNKDMITGSKHRLHYTVHLSDQSVYAVLLPVLCIFVF